MRSSNLDKQTDRTIYFDYLRILATFAVILVHLSSQYWSQTQVGGFRWYALTFFDGIGRWAVPAFVMISGALFLDREISIKKIYGKYVFRMVAAFAAWSVIYAIFSDGDMTRRLLILIKGRYHMWFIPMMVGLYISIPLLKPVASDKNLLKYYLALAFVFAFAIPQAITMVDDFATEPLITGVSALSIDLDNMGFYIVLGYTSYFILGYYLGKAGLKKKQRTVIYALGGLGFVLTMGLEMAAASATQQNCGNYFNEFTVNVLFETIAVFTWFKYRSYDFPKLYPFIQKLSKYSFGAYLVHALIIEKLDGVCGLNALSFNPVFAVPGIGLIVFVCSFVISGIINQIPILKKYIV